MEYEVYGDLFIVYPKPYSIHLGDYRCSRALHGVLKLAAFLWMLYACMHACMRVRTLSSQSRMENGHDDLRVKYDCYGPEGWSLLASCQVSRQVPQSSPDSPGKCGAHYYDWLFDSVLLLKGERGWLGTKLTLYSCTGGQGLYKGFCRDS